MPNPRYSKLGLAGKRAGTKKSTKRKGKKSRGKKRR